MLMADELSKSTPLRKKAPLVRMMDYCFQGALDKYFPWKSTTRPKREANNTHEKMANLP